MTNGASAVPGAADLMGVHFDPAGEKLDRWPERDVTGRGNRGRIRRAAALCALNQFIFFAKIMVRLFVASGCKTPSGSKLCFRRTSCVKALASIATAL